MPGRRGSSPPPAGKRRLRRSLVGRELGVCTTVIVPGNHVRRGEETPSPPWGPRSSSPGKAGRNPTSWPSPKMAAEDQESQNTSMPLTTPSCGTATAPSSTRRRNRDRSPMPSCCPWGEAACSAVRGRRNGPQRLGDVPVLACETEGAASFAAAVAAGEIVELEGITSVATSLGARAVAPTALELTRNHRIIPYVVLR